MTYHVNTGLRQGFQSYLFPVTLGEIVPACALPNPPQREQVLHSVAKPNLKIDPNRNLYTSLIFKTDSVFEN